MKAHFLEVTVAAAGAFAIVAALHHAPVMDLLYESAMSGGNISARATASLGDIASDASLVSAPTP
jgi:energy-converting hydrogenase Eha subunit C